MKTTASATLAAILLAVSAARGSAQSENLSSEQMDQDNAMVVIQFMNYLRYVSYEIGDYQNVFIIEDEYRNLSPDNLNLGKIPDEKIEQAIKDHLETLFELRLEEKDRERFESRLLQLKQRQRQDRFVHLAAAADSPSLVDQAVSVYDDYVNFQRQLEDENEDFHFKFDVNRLKRLHDNNLKNFDFTLDLIRRYGIDDKLRLTEEDAKALVSCLKASNKTGAFAQLKVMAKHQPSFAHFPFFWCQYASFAVVSEDPKAALKACDRFADVNRHSLFRRDRLAAQTAMVKVQAMMDLGMTNEVERVQIKEALSEIVRYNYDSHDYNMAYYCAQIAYDVLRDKTFALEVLNGLIGAQNAQSSKELVRYKDLFTKPTKDQKFEYVPMLSDLLRCVALKAVIDKGETGDSFRESVAAIVGNTVIQGVEKLFFVGEIRKSDLFARAKSEITAIRLEQSGGLLTKDVYHALVPAAWFVLGDYPVTLDLLRGTNTIETITDDFSKRTVVFDRSISPGALVKLAFPRKSHFDTARGIDVFRLNLPNTSWPISITYMPEGEQGRFKQVSAIFLGSDFTLTDMDAAKASLDSKAEKASKDSNSYCLAIPFPDDKTELDVNDLVSVEPEGNSLVLSWRNPDEFVGTLSVSAKYYNELESELCRADGDAKLSAGATGTIRLDCPAEMAQARKPAFVFLSCRRKKPLWNIKLPGKEP